MRNSRENGKKSIFRAIFVPLFVIMIFQSVIFYVAAVYGGIEETMNQNAADILTERLLNRKNDIEALFNKTWTNLDNCEKEVDVLYDEYSRRYGEKPFTRGNDTQVEFLKDISQVLVDTLRKNEVNGVYLILNDQKEKTVFTENSEEEKIGLCIRDLDQSSNYMDTEDLVVERSPSAVIEELGCSLDSWWEARYTFTSEDDGAFYYYPLSAAWENADVDSDDLAYLQGAHKISGSDQEVISYSIPLMDENGYPYGVLGIELTTTYLSSLMPNKELNESNKSCYILAIKDLETGMAASIASSGSFFDHCFGSYSEFCCTETTSTGGFTVSGRENTLFYGDSAELNIYNNNNPFEDQQLTLIALVERDTLFYYSRHIKQTLALVSLFSLLIGLMGMLAVSRRFSHPITALAKKVHSLPPQDGFQLDRLGIVEIDQLVDSIEELNRNASRDIARTEFFSRMSHDMRTPMNAIISFSSQELLEDADDAGKTEYLQKIHTSGEYLLGLINEVLDMTKIESNKVDLQYTPLHSTTLWETVIPIIDKLAQQKGVDFVKNILSEDAVIMVDTQHLNQIMINLLSNAVKFTPAGGTVQLHVGLETEEQDPNQMSCGVVVADNGIGMSEEFMRNLYTPFEQESEVPEGTGLGLSIARKLIEMMKGTITCTSKKGKGTVFDIQFVFQKYRGEAIETVKERAGTEEKNTGSLQGKRILVCEDQPINVQIIEHLLKRKAVEVTLAENGQMAVDTFADSSEGYFDAILMDIRMPVMDGLKASRTIRAMERTDAAVIPIIAMTANAFAEDVHASRQAGMNAHLSKPIEPQKLYDTLCHFIV